MALGLSVFVFAQQATLPAAAHNGQTLPPNETARVVAMKAIAGESGVLIEWRTSYELNNVGFILYREQGGRRVQVNKSIVPGAVLMVGDGVPLLEGYAYSAFDAEGTPDAKYYLESIALHGSITRHGVIPVLSPPGLKRQPKSLSQELKNASGDPQSIAGQTQSSWPASFANEAQTAGSVQDQWQIAAQPGLKIGVRQDDWYRLTQAQLVAAGLDANTDARNLRLFVNAQEVAIRVTRESGPLSPSDFIEFYGVGLDVPWSDKQVYWLTGGTQPGKRISIFGDVRHDGPVMVPINPPPAIIPPATPGSATNPARPSTALPSLPGAWSMPGSESVRNPLSSRQELKVANESDGGDASPATGTAVAEVSARENVNRASVDTKNAGDATRAKKVSEEQPKTSPPSAVSKPAAPIPSAQVSKKRGRRKARRSKRRRPLMRKNHAETVASPAASFLQTVARQDRVNYFAALQNGEAENYFGQILGSGGPTIQKLLLTNIETAAAGPAQLEVALQGIGSPAQYDIVFNEVPLGTMNIFYREHPVATYPIPMTLLREWDHQPCLDPERPTYKNLTCNDVKFVPTSGSGISFVDYVRLTYPHNYRAENNALRFTARFTQTVRVDGFTTPNVRVLDLTDPALIQEVRPIVESSASGYAITIPASGERAKGSRKLFAFADTQFQQPASVAFNTPSNLNATINGADLVIIGYADFIHSADALVSQRVGQGLSVSQVDVEDVFDEFAFGRHTPYALRDFLSWTAGNWAKGPQYAILLGDASADPRNYQAIGSFDFVPTKLVDTAYLETASDDWLADFDDDGLGEMALGRLPARTLTEANTMISKIVNFQPATVPQSALLVADAQGSYYFNFEEANDAVAELLPPTMTVQTVNRRTEPSDAAAKANIISKLNSGQALVNYSGHGNINAWAGSILTSSDALALTNGTDKLSFVVVMDCLNGYFIEPRPLGEGLAESLLKAQNGGAVAAFASSGETLPDGQHQMSQLLYQLLYSGPVIPLGDAIKQAKSATSDMDVRRTWIFFGDPTMKIR
jgi:hypothetical protein